MIVIRLLRAAVVVLTLSTDISVAQVVSQGVSDTPGPAVGAKAPAFQLSDQTGASHYADMDRQRAPEKLQHQARQIQ
jgi:hypothetical protein